MSCWTRGARRSVTVGLSGALIVCSSGCGQLQALLQSLGLNQTGNGAISVSRIITEDPALSTTPVTLPLSSDLIDGLGFKWHIEDDGVAVGGGNADFPDAFDGAMVLE